MTDWKREIEQMNARQTASEEARKNGATKYWYYITNDSCPACGSEDISKERMYTPKPEKWEDRHHYTETWNYCEL